MTIRNLQDYASFRALMMPSLLILAFLVLPQSISGAPLTKEKDPVPQYDGGVIYYMSYDNNLDPLGRSIIEMIRAGITSERTVAAVQADFQDPGGMNRFTIKAKEMAKVRITSDDSADEQQAIDYIDWFMKSFDCHRYIIIFLDHGGKHDEMCNDQNPDTPGKHWMSGQVLGEKLRLLKQKSGKVWELLFLQQCGRGSFENLYSFRGTASFIMSSPINVGAPNTYYTNIHKWLAENPKVTGDQLAAKIGQEDKDYTIYTCLRTPKLDELPARLNAAIEPFIDRSALQVPDKVPIIYTDGAEPIVDAQGYFKALAAANNLSRDTLTPFFNWINKELFAQIQVSPGNEGLLSRYCGLSLFVPSNVDELFRYRSLDFNQASKLIFLWQKLIKPKVN